MNRIYTLDLEKNYFKSKEGDILKILKFGLNITINEFNYKYDSMNNNFTNYKNIQGNIINLNTINNTQISIISKDNKNQFYSQNKIIKKYMDKIKNNQINTTDDPIEIKSLWGTRYNYQSLETPIQTDMYEWYGEALLKVDDYKYFELEGIIDLKKTSYRRWTVYDIFGNEINTVLDIELSPKGGPFKFKIGFSDNYEFLINIDKNIYPTVFVIERNYNNSIVNNNNQLEFKQTVAPSFARLNYLTQLNDINLPFKRKFIPTDENPLIVYNLLINVPTNQILSNNIIPIFKLPILPFSGGSDNGCSDYYSFGLDIFNTFLIELDLPVTYVEQNDGKNNFNENYDVRYISISNYGQKPISGFGTNGYYLSSIQSNLDRKVNIFISSKENIESLGGKQKNNIWEPIIYNGKKYIPTVLSSESGKVLNKYGIIRLKDPKNNYLEKKGFNKVPCVSNTNFNLRNLTNEQINYFNLSTYVKDFIKITGINM